MKESSVLVCTVLPTYNERDNIGPLIDGILASAITPHLVVVVDDNSPDGTWQVVQERMAVHNTAPRGDGTVYGESTKVVLSRRMDASGLTTAIQHGIDLAIQTFDADVVTWMDCDLSMPPQDVPKLVEAILHSGTDVAIGSRWIPGGADIAHGTMARLLSLLINRFAMLILGSEIHDYTSGFIAGRAAVLQQVRLRGDYGEYCIDLLARTMRMGYHVREVPYVCVPRTSGHSKTGANLWDYLVKGRKYVATILKYT